MRTPSERGGAVLWIFLILLAVMVWAGFRVGKVYFRHGTLENEISSLGDDALLRKNIDVPVETVKLLRLYDVVKDPEDIHVSFNTNQDRINIAFSYHRKVDLIFIHPLLGFDVDVERRETKAVGVIQSVQDNLQDSHNTSARKYQKAAQEAVDKSRRQ